jgi:hypothetical protein
MCVRPVRVAGPLGTVGGTCQMMTKKEMLGIAVKNGVAYGVVSLVAILFALCVLIEVLFELLMSLTTKLREKTMTLSDSIAKTFRASAISVTTQKLWTKLENAKDKVSIWFEKLGL